jgi:hypothetical protein
LYEADRVQVLLDSLYGSLRPVVKFTTLKR